MSGAICRIHGRLNVAACVICGGRPAEYRHCVACICALMMLCNIVLMQECEKKHESKHGTSVTRTLTKCEGAFTSLRKESSEDNNSAATSAFGDIAGHHHGHEGLEGKNLTFVACEGKYFNLVKTLPQNAGSDAAVHDFAGAEQLLDSENFGEGAASAGSKWQRSGLAGADNASAKASIMAQGCSGTLKAVIGALFSACFNGVLALHVPPLVASLPAHAAHVLQSACAGGFASVATAQSSGFAVSPAEKNVTAFVTCSGGYVEGKGGKSVGTVNEKLHAEMDRVSANLERKFMRGTPHLQHFTNRAGAATTVSSNEALDMAEASLASGVSAVPHLTDVNGGECKPTCNHKPLAWHGYWPCKCALLMPHCAELQASSANRLQQYAPQHVLSTVHNHQFNISCLTINDK